MEIRRYDPVRDFAAVARIWREVGWIEDTDEHRRSLECMLADGDAEVGLIAGEAECLVHRTPGTIGYERASLPLSAITGVTTSHIGRRQGLASTMTARAVQQGAESGAAVAALGMFEQGFYDRFGFGTASYDHQLTFDPSTLSMVGNVPRRTPSRLTMADAAEMQEAMSKRLGHHGAVVLDAVDRMAAELGWVENAYSLGYRDDAGRLTHFLLGSLQDEHGPFKITQIAYQDTGQLMELLRLVHELGDQVQAVTMLEPAEVQLQSLIESPMRQRQRSLKSDLESGNRALAWWQLRIVDIEASVGARHWGGDPVSANITLSDPIAGYLDSGWQGITGEYSITIASDSTVTDGHTGDLPVITCDVNAFTRMWFGVAPASSLVVTDRFEAPAELCSRLDDALRLPPVIPGCEF